MTEIYSSPLPQYWNKLMDFLVNYWLNWTVKIETKLWSYECLGPTFSFCTKSTAAVTILVTFPSDKPESDWINLTRMNLIGLISPDFNYLKVIYLIEGGHIGLLQLMKERNCFLWWLFPMIKDGLGSGDSSWRSPLFSWQRETFDGEFILKS